VAIVGCNALASEYAKRFKQVGVKELIVVSRSKVEQDRAELEGFETSTLEKVLPLADFVFFTKVVGPKIKRTARTL